MNRKLYDAILGLAIGDALGVPFEFKKRGTFLCTDMIGYGTHSQPKGTWSDDTSMVLATLDSLKSNNGQIVPEDMFARFNHWLQNSDYTAHGEVFDAGIATCNALRTGKPQTGEYDNGNGSLMRILPLAFVPCTDEKDCWQARASARSFQRSDMTNLLTSCTALTSSVLGRSNPPDMWWTRWKRHFGPSATKATKQGRKRVFEMICWMQ